MDALPPLTPTSSQSMQSREGKNSNTVHSVIFIHFFIFSFLSDSPPPIHDLGRKDGSYNLSFEAFLSFLVNCNSHRVLSSELSPLFLSGSVPVTWRTRFVERLVTRTIFHSEVVSLLRWPSTFPIGINFSPFSWKRRGETMHWDHAINVPRAPGSYIVSILYAYYDSSSTLLVSSFDASCSLCLRLISPQREAFCVGNSRVFSPLSL